MVNRFARNRLLIMALISFGLTGCSGFLDSNEPAATQWWLEPTALQTSAPPPFEHVAVDVAVVPGLDTDRILNLDDRSQLGHYAGAFWADHLPEVLDSLLVRTFEKHGDVSARSTSRAGEGECLLRLEATKFYGRIDAAGVTDRVEVALAGSLECDGQRRELRAEIEERVGENRMSTIVAAFQSALDRSVASLASQLTEG